MARIRATWLVAGAAAGALVAGPLPAADEPSVDRLDRRVDRLENIIDGGQIADLIQRIGELERELRELRGEIETQSHRMDELRKRQRNLYADLDRRIRQLEVAGTQGGSDDGGGTGNAAADGGAAAGDGEAASGDGDAASGDREAQAGQGDQQGAGAEQATGGDGSGDADAASGGDQQAGDPKAARKAYDAAFEMLKGGRYGESATAFGEFVEQYPDSPYADNAQYWLGESRYVTREFEAALEAFRGVIEEYPDSAKVPDARLKVGYTLYELDRLGEARSALEKVIQEHGNSAVARLAEERLLKIKRETQQSE